MTTLLAFDTATERIAVALAAGGTPRYHEGEGGAKSSATLLPAVRSLLEAAGIGLGAIDAIAFGRGPGAFTGLRTACSVAQGLAFGIARPVLALDTLMAVAEEARLLDPTARDVWAAQDARMGELYAAHYRHAGTGWQTIDAPALYGLDTLLQRWAVAPPSAVAGNAIDAFAGRLPTGDAALHAHAWPSPRALLALAQAAWDQGLALDPADALPLYLRDKVASTTDERLAARQGVQA